jgi:hypothetical protein
VRSIEGSGAVRSIEGSGAVRSIEGSGAVRSIEGSGAVRSIEGSGAVRSINGSGDVGSISGTSGGMQISMVAAGMVASVDESVDIALLGGLEHVGSGRIDVMGQEIDVSGLGIDEQEIQPQVGRLIYIEAKRNGDGVPTAVTVHAFEDLSIPGATPVFVRGLIDSVNKVTGRVSVGKLHIDVTNVRGEPLAVGEEVTITGTQPLPGGLILGAGRL